MTRPDISVIIPNLNSPFIHRTIAALQAQTVGSRLVEILVVGMDAPGLVTPDERVGLIAFEQPTSAAHNRNAGMAAARGDILCLTDADCIPDPEWLERLTAPFADPQVAVVGGGVRFDRANYWSLCDNLSWFYQFLESASPGTRSHLPTLNLALRRTVYEEVGGMSLSYPLAAGEDTEWTERMAAAGHALHFAPAAAVTHVARRTSFRALWRHGYDYGRYSPLISRPDGGRSSRYRADRLLPRGRLSMLLLSPLLAKLATIRTLSGHRVWAALPGIWISKLAWCMGAASALGRANIG